MKNADDILDETLGILDPVEKELGIQKMLTPVISRPSEEKEHIDADYEYQRENFYNLIEKGQDAIQGILNVAKEKMKRLKEVPTSAPKNVTNALFVGSTAELQKMLKGKKDE